MYTTRGSAFYGQFTDIPLTTRVSNFNSARRLLRTLPESALSIGDTFVDPEGTVFLVARHGDQFINGKHLYTHHKLFEMTDKVKIGRAEAPVRDPVSKQLLDVDPVWDTNVWIAFEVRSSAKDVVGVSFNRQELITGYYLKEGDLINFGASNPEAVVERVDKQLGVYIGQIQYE